MPRFIKNSIFYKTFYKIFVIPFRFSKLRILFNFIIKYIEESYIFYIFSKYLNKKPYFLNSISYKIFRKFIKFIDIIADFLNRILIQPIKNSFIFEETIRLKNNSIEKNFLLISILIASLNIGYIIGGVLFKSIFINPFAPIFMFILCSLFCIIGINKNCLEQSIFYKFIKLFKI